METTITLPLSSRINLRMVAFACFVLVLIGFPLYWYLDVALSGGVKDAGNGYLQVDLMTMVSFPFDQHNGTVDDVPPKWRQLDGKKVILVGEMAPMQSAAPEIDSFDLVYSVAKCCFTGEPQAQHFIHSKVVGGKKVPYYGGLVKARGTLHVDVRKSAENGKIDSVFTFDVEDVEPA